MSHLVLTRRENEGITIFINNSEIHLKIDEVIGKQAKISFEAKRNVEIWRDELIDAVCIKPHYKQDNGG